MNAMEVLDLESRRTVYEYVRDHPGLHLRGIARALGYPLGTALYHLDRLQRAEMVVVRQDGRYKRFFASNAHGRREKEYIACFHHAVPRRIVAALLARGPSTQRELVLALGVSRSTLSFYVTAMVRDGILRCEARRPENLYAPAEPELAARVLREQGAAFPDGVVDGFLRLAPTSPASATGDAAAPA